MHFSLRQWPASQYGQTVGPDAAGWFVCVAHRPRLVVAVLELLLVDQVLIDVVYEGLVTSLWVDWIPFAELCYLFLELLGMHHLRQ